MKIKFWIILIVVASLLSFISVKTIKKQNLNPEKVIGQKVDSLHGVYVFYNGGVGHVSGRNTSADGYNIGLKYQCVEFVKRYYYEYLNHKMPDSYGHAKSFYQKGLKDGALNKARDLTQYSNTSTSKPAVGDLLVFDGTIWNRYGHVAIVSAVSEDDIEIIQQNPGPFGDSRIRISLQSIGGKWQLDNDSILGWLRK